MALTEQTILSLCEQEFRRGRDALGDIRKEQQKALNQYFLRPNGKERAGYSHAQTSETRDAIEQMLPILLDMYLQPEPPVTFRPRSAEDMKQAQQETTLVNDVIFNKNDGAIFLSNWFKNALLVKNGYVKVYWDENVDDRIEKYKCLSQEELSLIMSKLDERDEVFELKEEITNNGIEYSIKIRVVNGDPQIKIKPISTMRVVVAAEHDEVSLAEANYCCHYDIRTKSSLVTDGFKKDKVQSISAYSPDEDDEFNVTANLYQTSNNGDWSRDLVVVYEHYIRADKNGDGKAELLQVISAGSSTGGTILSIEEVDFVPIIAITPCVIPNSHFGMALADITAQYQDIATHIQRQILDNLNLTNNPQIAVNKGALANPEALAKQRLGGVILTNGDPNLAVSSFSVPFMADKSYLVLQDLKARVEASTGLSEAATGLNADALAQSTNLVGAMALGQAQLRARMIATVMAQTGFRELVLRVRELVKKHMEKEEIIEVSGEYLPVDPRSWVRSRPTTVRIGLGAVQKAERMAALQNIMALQEKVFAAQQGLSGPLLTAGNVYNTLTEIAQMTGAQGNDRYFSNPQPFLEAQAQQGEEPQPVETALELEGAKLAITAQKDAAEIEIKNRELDIKEEELALKKAQLQMKAMEPPKKNSIRDKYQLQ